MSGVTIAGRAPWLDEPTLQKLLAALSAGGEEARIAGGAVRNALMGASATDVDIATTNLPADTIERVIAAGFKAIPTGIEHGTITVVAEGRAYEVTTLRADVETDGRHAKVVFGRDWTRDAERRDFTINALYAQADGTVIDLVGGLADLDARRLRFIGDAEARIREDYLRILRFFRFFAWYGTGRPDAEGLKASARLKDGLSRLSAERVWSELKKLFSAPDPARAALWMRQAGVLGEVVPETVKWGIDALPAVVAAGRDLGWPDDPMLRLAAIVPQDGERMKAMAERLRMSRDEARRLQDWAGAPAADATRSDMALAKAMYRSTREGVIDRLRIALATVRADSKLAAAGLSRQLKFAEGWDRPKMPLGGRDLEAIGMSPGKAIGDALRTLEAEWIDSGFALERGALLERAAVLKT